MVINNAYLAVYRNKKGNPSSNKICYNIFHPKDFVYLTNLNATFIDHVSLEVALPTKVGHRRPPWKAEFSSFWDKTYLYILIYRCNLLRAVFPSITNTYSSTLLYEINGWYAKSYWSKYIALFMAHRHCFLDPFLAVRPRFNRKQISMYRDF